MRKRFHGIFLSLIILLAALPATLAATPPVAPVGEAPLASFVYSPTAPRAHDIVRFESTSTDRDGFIVAQRWTFEGHDDAVPTLGASATRAFRAAGDYAVTLHVMDSSGRESHLTLILTVVNSPPELHVMATPSPAFRGTEVEFTANATDRDGDAITTWRWDFGDGATSTTGPEVVHRYHETGRYLVTLHATDTAGESAAASVMLYVVNQPPVITNATVAPPAPTPGDTVWFNATAHDPDGAPGDALAYTWRFSDGMKLTGSSVQRTFATVGHHTVTLAARDADGAASSPWTTVVRVDHAPPVADFTFAPATPIAGERVTFTDASSSARGNITQWRWDFGDGATSTLQHPTHTYAHGGDHVVRLMVTDSNGRIATAERAVDVDTRPAAST